MISRRARRKFIWCLFAVAGLTIGLAFLDPAARASEMVWNGAGSSTWSTGSNWVGGSAPSSTDTASFKGWAPLPRSGWSVTASATYSGYPVSNTVDGRPSTYWMNGALQSSGVWVRIDMGSAQTFGGLDMDSTNSHNTDYARGFDIYVSSDGTTWGSAVYSGTGSSALLRTTFTDQTARYIKIQLNTGDPTYWWTVEEVRVWGTTAGTKLSHTGWTATAFNTDGASPLANAIDGTLTTRWASGLAQANSNQWFKIDLGANRTFTGVSMDSYNNPGDYAQTATIQVSTNDSSYTTVVSATAQTAEFTFYSFSAQTARYIKILQTGSTSNWWSMTEVDVYGTPVGVSTSASTTLAGLNLSNGVTFTQASGHTLTINGSWSQSAGTFTGGNSQISLTGSLNLSGGTFTSTSGLLIIGGAFNATGGTFTHSNGRVLLSSTGNQTFATNGATFYDLFINDGLLGYWKLDETSLGTAADSSGYGNSGTHSNSPTLSSSVPTVLFSDPRSVSFNGTNQYISLGNPSLLNFTGRITMAAWINNSNTSGQNNILAHGYTDSPAGETVIRINNGSYSCASWNGTNYEAQYTVPGADLNTWVHLACTWNGSAWNVYRNGVLVQSTSAAQGALPVSANWAIGSRGDGGDRYFHGLIDDVRLYNRTLSASEISALAAGNQPGTSQATQTMTGAPTVASDLTLATGTLAAGANAITVTGGWNNYGGRFTSTGTITLNGTGSEVIRSAGQPFYNLTLNGSGATWSLEDWLKVSGTLTMTSGALSAGSYAVHAAAMSKTSGTFTAGTGTVVMDGIADTTQGTGFSFNNLRVETPDETGLVGYWKFDEGQGVTIRDASGTGNDGTLTSTSWTTSLPSAIGFDNHAALSMNGSTSYATVGTTSMPANNASQSISAWVNFSNTTGGDYYLVSLWNPASGGSGTSIGIHGSTLAAWKWGATVLASLTAPATGSWHHVAYTFDGTTHKLYLDGGTPNTSTTAPNTLTPTNVQIGTYNGSFLHNGQVDDVRIYSVALTAAQVKNLAQGRYSGVGTATSVTLGANSSASGVLAVDSGTLATSTYTMNASAAGNVVQIGSGGTYQVGSATQTMSGGLTVQNGGTLSLPTASGTVAIGSGKTLTMDGTLAASSTTATIQSVSGTYTFSIGSTSTATPTLNITGLKVKNTDANGMNINVDHSASTTFTRFDNIAFTNGAGTGAGNYNLQVYATSLYLTANGCTFDSGVTATVASNVKLTGNGGATRIMFGNSTCASDKASCEAYDSDDDNSNNVTAAATPDGLGDSSCTSCAVIQWIRGSLADTTGSIEGFPTAAFDWSSFTYYSTYAAFHDVSGTIDRVYVRDSAGAARYYWDSPSGVDLIGTPRWDTVSGTHYVYVATTSGKVYRLIDNTVAQTLAPDTASPWDGANNPFDCSCTITTPLIHDTSNVYWGGIASSTHKLWTLSKTTAAPNRQPSGSPLNTSTTTNNASPAIWTSGSTYAFLGENGRVQKINVSTQGNVGDNTNPGSSNPVTGRITVIASTLYAGDDNGYMWSLDPGANFVGTTKNWGYHDGTNHAACGVACPLKNHYVDAQYTRVYVGDQDGHLYVLNSSGAAVTGYPWRPGTSADAFATAPLYGSGVIVIGGTNGFLYVIDQNSNGSIPAVIQTYKFGGSSTAVSGVAYDGATGSYMISTANATSKDGKLYYITASSDPTSGFL